MGKRKLTDEQEHQVCELYQEGLSSLKLAEKFGVGKGVILGTLRRADIKRRPCRKYGNKPRQKLTSQEEQKLIDEFERGCTMEEIHQEHNISRRDLQDLMQRHGIKTKRGSSAKRIDFTDEQETEMIKLYEEGLSIKEVGKHFGLSHAPIRRVLSERGVEFKNPHAKRFSSGEEKAIAEEYEQGNTTIERLAKKYKAGLRQISDAIHEYNVDTNYAKHSLDEHAFDAIDSEEAAYWLGFIYADGCVYKGQIRVMLKDSDRNHLQKLKVFLDTERSLYSVAASGYNATCKKVLLHIHNVYLANKLRGLGIVAGRTKWKRTANTIPKCLARHFIRGYMDGDGSIGSGRPRIRFCGAEDILLWIKNVVALQASVMTKSIPRKTKHGNIFTFGFNGRNKTRKILKWLYKGATIFMDRKMALAEVWMAPSLPKE